MSKFVKRGAVGVVEILLAVVLIAAAVFVVNRINEADKTQTNADEATIETPVDFEKDEPKDEDATKPAEGEGADGTSEIRVADPEADDTEDTTNDEGNQIAE